VFENRVMRIPGRKREEVTGGWRKWTEKFHNLYSSVNIIRMIRSRRMTLVGYGREKKCI
jgi:hypothetical protein